MPVAAQMVSTLDAEGGGVRRWLADDNSCSSMVVVATSHVVECFGRWQANFSGGGWGALEIFPLLDISPLPTVVLGPVPL